MSHSGKLETISPALRRTTVGPAYGSDDQATGIDVVVSDNQVAGKVADGEVQQISTNRAQLIETPERFEFSIEKPATAGATVFSIQSLLSLLPSWSISLAGHGAILVVLAVIATSPIHDGSAALRLDGMFLDSAEFEEFENNLSEIETTEKELLKVDVASLNSEASEDTADIVRDDGLAVSLVEGLADGIGMESLGTSGLTPIESTNKGGGQATEGTSTKFFGTQAAGSRFVFIIDASGSMTQGFRWHHAVRELERSIGELTEKQEVMVLVYNFQTIPMFYTPPKNLKLLPATDEFKKRLNNWLADLTPIGGTRPAHALKYSLTLEPDAIFLLSDGMLADNSIEMLAKRNKARGGDLGKIPVHAVSLGPNADGAELMKIIADNNNGEFNWVR